MERVVLFARVPRRGAVKTRLAPPLSDDEALALHEAMLADQIAFVSSFAGPGRTAEICLDATWPEDRPRPDGLEKLPHTLQGEGSLGARLERTLARGHAAGTRRIAIVGADAPTLPARIVDEAFRRLADGADAVVSPARDGGYVLVATAGRCPALFHDVPWGTERVLEVTRRRARDAGLDLRETEGWFDVDRVEDFAPLLDGTESERRRAPKTAALAPTLRLYLPERPVL
ncbi:MAG TPA: TIGR04282 family arsenosugar biosynthesis glycosyltransferase [Candidatus Polarisedimenticolaceae bacterium]|nr:TIGR04282 family arsenosugar biosynthesis glycosyltransferase [Candidatus Polarisedimenticolaceae bacterium]